MDERAQERDRMVSDQVEGRGVRNAAVLAAMREVPRHRFVPDDQQRSAYDDFPLPIGHGSTISQPYIVGLMTELARPGAGDVALEVGTGCGYQTAVLARLVSQVYSIEIVEELSRQAGERLAALGCHNVSLRVGDGHKGWPEHAPYDIILSAAAPEVVPQPLLDQLAPGGRLVIPAGPQDAQELLLMVKAEGGRVLTRAVTGVRFVPLVHGRD
ncbi:MAG TPA: protein-L-isoaspartate(D-aspartate) O-methyltransferase [Vicinamibacterales bacterium]|nr:protein-L-isoaspartate(D-aspartate) O-methyltransferase [Vicinamibacterales bacterium]